VVLGLPVDVFISVVVPIVGAPVSREGVLIRARTCRVGVVRRNGASVIWTAPDMGDGALVSLVSPSVAETAKFPLVTLTGVMADLVTGFASCPGSLILGALGPDVATVSTHGTEGVHIDDVGGGWVSGRRDRGSGVDSGVCVKRRRSGGGRTDSRGGVKEGRAYHAFCGGMVCFLTDGTRGRGPSLAFIFVPTVGLASSASSGRRNRDRCRLRGAGV
jgi:hypothetical protein